MTSGVGISLMLFSEELDMSAADQIGRAMVYSAVKRKNSVEMQRNPCRNNHHYHHHHDHGSGIDELHLINIISQSFGICCVD